jgi:ribosomal protein L10
MSSERKVKKQNLIKKVYELVSKHDQVVIVSLMNVGSNQVQMIRRSLGKLGATLLIGKNTVMKKAMTLRTQKLEDIKNVEEKEFFS